MRERDLAALELPRVCARVAEFAASPVGKEACLARAPAAEREVAERELERSTQCIAVLEKRGEPPLRPFPDIRPHLRASFHEGFVLDGIALVELRSALAVAADVCRFFRRSLEIAPALADIPQAVRVFPNLQASLARALDDEGGVLDHASDELAAVRRTIRSIRGTLTRRLEQLVARQGMADVLSDTYVTIRNNRFVVPVRTAAAGRLPGVVQDRSVSGETLFVEPLFAVELNNELMVAVKEEEAVVQRILADLTDLVRSENEAIESTFAALAEVDALVARARFAKTYRCSTPLFSDGEISLRDARHPGLLFTGRPVTPVDFMLPADKRVLVLTGPNTGGKTVALKTLGLCALMAQSGLPIPAAEGATLPFFSGVFTDVGDEQNIERNLSTFSAHIGNLCEILAAPGESPLVLLDEPGVGTDPEDGAALAVGLLRRFEKMGARVAITTHYTPVKLFALGHPACVVAAVDFDMETLAARYRLVYHSIGRSLALPIAERLGLPGAVLTDARAALSEESVALTAAVEELEGARRTFEARLAEVDRRAAEVEAREAETARLFEEARERRRRAWSAELKEARDFLRRTKSEGRAMLSAVRRGAADRRELQRFVRERETAVAERSAIDKPPSRPLSPGPVRVGDTVQLAGRRIQGKLIAVEGERAWLQRGTMRFEVPKAQLCRVDAPARQPVQVRLAGGAGDRDAPAEISLLGLRAHDAVERLQVFLDRAVQARHERVCIIHGVGSGALRRAVHDYLSQSPYCLGFRIGDDAEGGERVTMAMLDR